MPLPPLSDVAQDALDKIFQEAIPQPPSDPGELPEPLPDNDLVPLSGLFDGGDPGQSNHPEAGDIGAPIWGEAPPQLPDLSFTDDSSGDIII
jgi:hypothetical protein